MKISFVKTPGIKISYMMPPDMNTQDIHISCMVTEGIENIKHALKETF